MSLFVTCEDQEEVDYFWKKLTEADGEPGQCGWLKDKFGVSWQITPKALGELMNDLDREKSGRVMQAGNAENEQNHCCRLTKCPAVDCCGTLHK